jgi:hypothetical protein
LIVKNPIEIDKYYRTREAKRIDLKEYWETVEKLKKDK